MDTTRSPFGRLSAALALATLTAAGSCGGGTEPVRTPTQVVVTPATVSLMVGETRLVTAEPRDATGLVPGQTVAWSSSNPAVATVVGGTISAISVGSATITASSGGHQATVAVTVTPIPVATVSVAPTQKTVIVTQTTQLAATPMSAAGAALADRPVAWSSSDDAIATVSSTGLVTTKAVGTATISATSEGRTGTATITVIPVPVASLRITPGTAEIFMGEQHYFDVVTLDADGEVLTGRTVTWTSSDGTIATVFALNPTTGAVTGNNAGPVTITATSEGKSATLAVTVLYAPRLRLGVSGMPAPYGNAPIRLRSDDAGFLADLDIPGGPPVNFNRLAPGTYTLTAKPITVTLDGVAFTYLPAESEVVRTFTITTNATVNVNLVWTLRSGALAVTVAGLPSGAFVACTYQFAPPGISGVVTGGFTIPTAQTTTVAAHGSGPATLSCQTVTIGSVNYRPTVATQSLNVPASTTPLAVTVTYEPY